jgi:hypothetical protein
METNLDNVKKALKSLRLPDWVQDWRIEDDVDRDGDPLLRVWLAVEEDFDPKRHADLYETEDKVRQCVRDAGVNDLVMVVLESPVAG